MSKRYVVFTLCLHLFGVIRSQVDTFRTDSLALRTISDPVYIYGVADEKPFACTRIPGKKIATLKEPIIEPLLNATPGIWMQSGTLNTNRISIRGIGYREPFATTGIRVYYDEIPLTNGSGEASIEDIHPLMLSEIEVLRGPSSAQSGAGLGGMILLKSRVPELDTWKTGLQLGSFGRFQIDQHLSLVHGAGDHWSTAMHYQYLNDDGFRENNDYSRYSMSLLQKVEINDQWDLQTLIHAIALQAQIPSSLSLADYQNHPEIAVPSWAMVHANEDYQKLISGVTLTHRGKRGRISKSSVFATRFTSDEVRPFNVLEEGSTTLGLRHRVAIPLAATTVITSGVEFSHEQYNASTFETLSGGSKGEFLADEIEDRTHIHFFANTEWSVQRRTSIHGGLSIAGMFLSGERESFDAPVSVYPVIGVRHALGNCLTLSASVSRGYTAMSIDDLLNSEGQLQKDLRPETGWSEEIGLHLSPNERIGISMTSYLMQIRNTIITRRTINDLFERYNGGETAHRGIEAELRINPSDKIRWTAAYTCQHHTFSKFNHLGTDFSGKRLPGIPPHRLYQAGQWQITDALQWEIQHHWVSAIYLDDLNTGKGIPYNLINTTINYAFTMWSDWQVECSLYVHNVFDVNYVPMYQINAPGQVPRYYYPGKPRAVYVGVKVKV